MATSPNSSDDRNVPPKSSTVILLIMTMADTTWRLFIPIVGLMLAGLILDKRFATTPWLMIVGIGIGIVAAAWLIYLQLKRVKKT